MGPRVISALQWISDPDEVLRKAGVRRATLRSLRTDDEISGALDTRVEAVIGTPWRLEPSDGAAAGFLWEQMEPHMEALVRGAWSAVPYGYSVVQVIYSSMGGRVGIQHVIEEQFEEFVPTLLGDLLMWDGKTLEEHKIDPRRLLLTVRQPTRQNPYGEALLSPLYWPWFFRRHGWNFWLKWLERFGSPFLVGTTKGSVADMAAALEKAVNAASMAMSEGDLVTTVEQKQGAGHFESFDSVITSRVQKLILGQTLTTDVGDKGSFAAAKVHNEVRQDKRNADIRLVTATIQRLVNYLWGLNNFGGKPPKFVMADDTGLEKERAERDAILSEKMGVEFTDAYLTDRYDLEPGDFTRKEAIDVVPGEKLEKPQTVKASLSVSSAQEFTAGQNAIESAFGRLLNHAPAHQVDFDAVRSAVMGASDPQDLEKRLAQLIGREDPQFEAILAQAMFSAQVLGFVTA
jgi:phage gp29-like protein